MFFVCFDFQNQSPNRNKMSLMCQKNSYLKEFKSPIVSCQSSTLKIDGQQIDGFDVVLEDTIFFPEGGGQPYDLGFLGDKQVNNVRRVGNKAILFVRKDDHTSGDGGFEVGQEPEQKIDWDRRFDHMQQHSGQHLITACAIKHFNLLTTSWSLGLEVSNIELDSANISTETMEQLENIVNEKIRENLPIVASYRHKDDLAQIRQQMELPTDIDGELRIITIESLDQNPCCGTHVASLCHLQMIKLLGVQKGKKEKCLLTFIVGNRVLKFLNDVLHREKLLSSALKCSSSEFFPIVDKLQKNVKRLQKNCTTAMRDLAKQEAEKYRNMADKPLLYSVHRKESEYDFISNFLSTLGEPFITERLILLSIADDCNVANSPGQIVIAGQKDLVEKCGSIASQSFSAKGSVSQGRFRGRIPDVSKLSKLEEIIRSEVLN